MTSTGESIWYLEWLNNFRLVIDSKCGAPAGRYVSIHVGCTGHGAYRPLRRTVQNIVMQINAN